MQVGDKIIAMLLNIHPVVIVYIMYIIYLYASKPKYYGNCIEHQA